MEIGLAVFERELVVVIWVSLIGPRISCSTLWSNNFFVERQGQAGCCINPTSPRMAFSTLHVFCWCLQFATVINLLIASDSQQWLAVHDSQWLWSVLMIITSSREWDHPQSSRVRDVPPDVPSGLPSLSFKKVVWDSEVSTRAMRDRFYPCWVYIGQWVFPGWMMIIPELTNTINWGRGKRV